LERTLSRGGAHRIVIPDAFFRREAGGCRVNVKERRVLVRRRADREFLDLVEKKTGLRPQQLLMRSKRRRVIRHLCKAELTLDTAESLGEGPPIQRIEGRVLDLSEGGVALFAPQEVSPGQHCHVRLKLIDGGPIESSAEIRWANRKEAKDGYAIGVRFVDLDDFNAKRLDAFLTKLDATLGL
jgi:c-di-GMP-binding flagellar brake protein YcgR